METSAVGNNAVVSARQQTSRGFQDMTSEDFFALLIAELKSQDPLDPMDNKALLDQMSSIRQMQQSSALNETLGALAAAQRFGSTASLIGHYVLGSVTNEAGESYQIEGVVVGVRYEGNGHAILELHNGKSLPAEDVDEITLVENLPPEILEQLQAEMEGLTGAEGG